MIRGTPDHPKTLDLMRRLGASKPLAVGLLEMLWHFTAAYAPRGDVGRFSDEQIARAVGWDGEAPDLVAALAAAGFLDQHRRHRFVIHDWPEWADDAVHRRLARAHERFANGQVPKLTRLNANERSEIAAHYRAHGGRTLGALTPPRQSPAPPEPRPARAGAPPEPHPAPPEPEGPAPSGAIGPAAPDPGEILTAVKVRLEHVVEPNAFATWFRPLEQAEWRNGIFAILAPTVQHRDWLRQCYPDEIKSALRGLGHACRVQIVVRARDPAAVESDAFHVQRDSEA